MPTACIVNLDFDLWPDIDTLRNTARGFAAEKITPYAAEIDRTCSPSCTKLVPTLPKSA